MAGRLIFLTLAAVLNKANSQLCGLSGSGPILQGPLPAQLGSNYNCINPCLPPLTPAINCPQPVITPPLCNAPVVATTILDNSLSNSLANAIQLLIVSNLIGNTLNAGILPGTVPPVCDAFLNPIPCNPFEYVTIPSNTVGPCFCEGPIIDTVVPNICGCGDIGPFPGYTLTEVVTPMQQTFAPLCSEFPPTIYSGVDCGIPTLAPIAAEVLFPSSIPAQLTCNFGYMNTNVPCVSVNVEPLQSFDACCSPNLFGNGFFY